MTPTRVFTFTPLNTKPFYYRHAPKTATTPPDEPPPPPPDEPSPPDEPPGPKITDYLLPCKKRCSDAAVKGTEKLNAQRVLEFAEAL